MSNSKHPDVIDEAVEFLREHYRLRGKNIRSAHAHAAVAHYLGYNSKVALKCDPDFDATDADMLSYRNTGIGKLVECVPRMKPSPLQEIDPSSLSNVIHAGLAPACECCNEKSLSITPLGYEEREPDGWVCQDCADRQDEDYATCRYCGDDYIYRASEINHRGECPEHDGESVYDEEEEEDMDSLVEYFQNH